MHVLFLFNCTFLKLTASLEEPSFNINCVLILLTVSIYSCWNWWRVETAIDFHLLQEFSSRVYWHS